MPNHDDPKDVEREVDRPAINSWTENDTPDAMKKKPGKKQKQDPRTGIDQSERTPGTGRPDADEGHGQGRQGSK